MGRSATVEHHPSDDESAIGSRQSLTGQERPVDYFGCLPQRGRSKAVEHHPALTKLTLTRSADSCQASEFLTRVNYGHARTVVRHRVGGVEAQHSRGSARNDRGAPIQTAINSADLHLQETSASTIPAGQIRVFAHRNEGHLHSNDSQRHNDDINEPRYSP